MAESNNSTASLSQLRVLVVENRVKSRQTTEDNLIRWGYEPVVAEGVGEELMEEAKRLAQARCCHVALVDKRLRDDYDPQDTSGLELIKDLKPTESIILTAYADHPTTRAALKAGAFDVVVKQDGPQPLRDALERVAELWNPGLKIHWPSTWSSSKVQGILASPNTKEGAESQVMEQCEIDLLLERLFRKAQTLHIRRLNNATRGSDSVNAAIRHGAVVMSAQADARVPVILKFAKQEKIKEEKENYERFVKDYIGEARRPELAGHIIGWATGCIVYTLTGAEGGSEGETIQTFERFFIDRESNDDQVVKVINNFFAVVWFRNYQRDDLVEQCAKEREKIKSEPLFNHYNCIWKGILTQQDNQLDETCNEYERELPGLPGVSKWIVEHQKDSLFTEAQTSIVHGDLHGENILLDTHQLPWVIDFEDTGCSHRLRDCGELAQNILTRLFPLANGGDDFARLFYQLCVWVCRLPKQRQLRIAGIQPGTPAWRTYRVLKTIEDLALETLRGSHEELLWVLLYDCRKMLGVLQPTSERYQRLCKLAGIIAMRLDRGTDKIWPPESWPPVKWISKENNPVLKILFLAANPTDTGHLRLDQECREVRDSLQRATSRGRFQLASEFAVRLSDLLRLLLQHKPTIVHFAGHGSEAGEILLENEGGVAVPLSKAAVAELFGELNRGDVAERIRCVVLNACYTEEQAQMLAAHVDVVIGVSKTIADAKAVEFATAFYTALGEGESVARAFRLARIQTKLTASQFDSDLRIFSRPGIDPDNYFLIAP